MRSAVLAARPPSPRVPRPSLRGIGASPGASGHLGARGPLSEFPGSPQPPGGREKHGQDAAGDGPQRLLESDDAWPARESRRLPYVVAARRPGSHPAHSAGGPLPRRRSHQALAAPRGPSATPPGRTHRPHRRQEAADAGPSGPRREARTYRSPGPANGGQRRCITGSGAPLSGVDPATTVQFRWSLDRRGLRGQEAWLPLIEHRLILVAARSLADGAVHAGPSRPRPSAHRPRLVDALGV